MRTAAGPNRQETSARSAIFAGDGWAKTAHRVSFVCTLAACAWYPLLVAPAARAGCLASVAGAPVACGTNGGFESGTLWAQPVSWQVDWDAQPGAPAYPLTATGQTTVWPPAFNTCGGAGCGAPAPQPCLWPYVRVVDTFSVVNTGGLLSSTYAGARSCELYSSKGYWLPCANNPCPAPGSYSPHALTRQTFTVPAGGVCISLWYAGLFDSGHFNDTNDCRITISLECSGASISCFTYYAASPQSQMGQNGFFYLPWTQYVSPCLPAGCTATLQVTAHGCGDKACTGGYGAHSSIAYLDEVTCGNVNSCCFLASPTPTGSPTRTRTHSRTHTQSRTGTVTRTNSPTRTETRTYTISRTPSESRTATPTRTSTATPTETYTVTLSLSASFTRTFTATFTESLTPCVTMTSTETATVTETFTDTATATESYTVTETFTVSRTPTTTRTATETATYTPTPTPTVIVIVLVYNQAGERVRRFDESLPVFLTVPSGVTAVPNPFSPDGDGADDVLAIVFENGASVHWDGRSDDGAYVDNGIYHLVVSVVEVSGRTLLTVTESAAVLARGNIVSVRILDLSGAVRRRFPDARGPKQVRDLTVQPNPFSAGLRADGSWHTCLIKVLGTDELAAPAASPSPGFNLDLVHAWRGEDDEGRLLDNGTYWAEASGTDRHGRTVRITRSLVMLRGKLDLLRDVRAYPNPKPPTDADPWTYFAYTLPDADPVPVTLRIFDAQGQQVARRNSWQHGSPDPSGIIHRYRIAWNTMSARRLYVSDGLYFAELSARDEAAAVVQTRRLKFAVVRRK